MPSAGPPTWPQGGPLRGCRNNVAFYTLTLLAIRRCPLFFLILHHFLLVLAGNCERNSWKQKKDILADCISAVGIKKLAFLAQLLLAIYPFQKPTAGPRIDMSQLEKKLLSAHHYHQYVWDKEFIRNRSRMVEKLSGHMVKQERCPECWCPLSPSFTSHGRYPHWSAQMIAPLRGGPFIT